MSIFCAGTWTRCANNEGDTCTCTGKVIYGRKFVSGKPGSGTLTSATQLMSHVYKQNTASGSVPCSNDVMGGDPAGGYYKHCFCRATAGGAPPATRVH